MTTSEAKEIIKKEFMDRYYTWMQDRFNLNDHDYGWKYGWCKSEKMLALKDNLKTVAIFHKYFYPNRRVERIEKELGIDRKIIWELSREKWISDCQHDWKTYYFVSQARAKEIWKESKA